MTSSCQETPPDEQYPNLTTSLPELSSYPKDIEGRRALNQTLAGRCLNFPNKMSGSKVIRSTINYVMDDPGDPLDLELSGFILHLFPLDTSVLISRFTRLRLCGR